MVNISMTDLFEIVCPFYEPFPINTMDKTQLNKPDRSVRIAIKIPRKQSIRLALNIHLLVSMDLNTLLTKLSERRFTPEPWAL